MSLPHGRGLVSYPYEVMDFFRLSIVFWLLLGACVELADVPEPLPLNCEPAALTGLTRTVECGEGCGAGRQSQRERCGDNGLSTFWEDDGACAPDPNDCCAPGAFSGEIRQIPCGMGCGAGEQLQQEQCLADGSQFVWVNSGECIVNAGCACEPGTVTSTIMDVPCGSGCDAGLQTQRLICADDGQFEWIAQGECEPSRVPKDCVFGEQWRKTDCNNGFYNERRTCISCAWAPWTRIHPLGGSDPCRCRPSMPDQLLANGLVFSRLNWEIPTAQSDLEFELRLSAVDPANTQAHTPFDGLIEGKRTFIGFQTRASGAGPFILFRKAGTTDPTDARAAPNGTIETDLPNSIIGTRFSFQWVEGAEYVIQMHRQPSDGNGNDWFHLFIAPKGQTPEFVGGLRYTRVGTSPATLAAAFSSYGFLYDSDGTTASSIPLSYIELGLTSPRPLRVLTEFSEFANSSTAWDPVTRRYRLQFGGETPRCMTMGDVTPPD